MDGGSSGVDDRASRPNEAVGTGRQRSGRPGHDSVTAGVTVAGLVAASVVAAVSTSINLPEAALIAGPAVGIAVLLRRLGANPTGSADRGWSPTTRPISFGHTRGRDHVRQRIISLYPPLDRGTRHNGLESVSASGWPRLLATRPDGMGLARRVTGLGSGQPAAARVRGVDGVFGRRTVLFGLLLVLIQAGFPAAGGANHRLGVHWAREDNPFTVEFGTNGLGSDWTGALRHAGSVWERSKVLDTRLVPGKTNPRTCDMTRGRVEVCAADYGPTGWVGATRFHRQGDHITAAWIKFNEYYFSPRFPESNNAKARRNTACHEMGHALGLGHGSEGPFKESCLYVDTSRRIDHPSQHDFVELERIYRHTDNSSTLDGARAVGDVLTIPDRPVPTGGPKQGHVFVDRLDDGSELVTIVDWR